MSTTTGATQILRLIGRIERVRLTLWIFVLGLIPVAVAASFLELYPTEDARRELAATVATSPGLVALLGPITGSSVGSLTIWRIGTIGAVLLAVMAAFTVIRHTRVEEETGRRELVGSSVLGRHAPLLAATIAAVLASTAIGLLVAIGLTALGEDIEGALAFGVGWLLTGVVFAAVGALAAQLTASSGGARTIAGGIIGLGFALRMAGDGGAAGWLSWLSPFGWVTKLEPFGDERWWVALLFVVVAGVTGTTAFIVSARRDVGAGVVPPRPGPANAAPGLGTPMGLAWRLHRPPLIGWLVGVGLFATVWGGLGETIADLFDDNPQLAEIFEAFGGQGALTDMFFSVAMGIVALIVSVYTVDATYTMRTEEEGLRAEPVLATATSRLGWLRSHVAFAVLGPVVLMTVAGLAAGFTHGLVAGDVVGRVAALLGAALLQVPAIWVMTGVAVALYGAVPRYTALAWGALVIFLLVGQLGPILQLPQWTIDMSPFSHVPMPPEPVSFLPLVALSAVAAALIAWGALAFQRRDMR